MAQQAPQQPPRGRRFAYSADIEQSIEKCYNALIRFEDYPTFISGLQTRRKGDEDVWQWTFSGLKNEIVQWDLKLDSLRHRNNVISWHTIRNASIPHSGAITLEALPDQKTRLHFVVEYDLPLTLRQTLETQYQPQGDAVDQWIEQALISTINNFRSTVSASRAQGA